ncbi:MmyB family transcriptional regulator [Streptomyces sp. NBC_01237]|nr:hypothetical protein [Streptomyces sp. NBC_01237]WRZ70290.1 hypothetical protein OG251_00850 [Streptomyces sp. NBC_01237]
MDLRPEHTSVLAKLLPYPAAVQTDCYDLVAANRTYRYLFADLDAYPVEERNCAWLMFTEPSWRNSLVDEDSVLREITAKLRTRQPEHRDDPRWNALITRLRQESPDFVRHWESYEIVGDRTQLRRYRSPRVGALDVQFQSLWMDRVRGERIIVMTPTDVATAQRLERLDSLVGAAPAWTSRGDSADGSAAGA